MLFDLHEGQQRRKVVYCKKQKMAKEYTVVSAFTIGLLIDKVNELIKEGWQPIGGISSNGQQAMIR